MRPAHSRTIHHQCPVRFCCIGTIDSCKLYESLTLASPGRRCSRGVGRASLASLHEHPPRARASFAPTSPSTRLREVQLPGPQGPRPRATHHTPQKWSWRSGRSCCAPPSAVQRRWSQFLLRLIIDSAPFTHRRARLPSALPFVAMGRKATQEERQALAAANGYERGQHREKDCIRDDNRLTEPTIRLQEEALAFYKEYVRTREI